VRNARDAHERGTGLGDAVHRGFGDGVTTGPAASLPLRKTRQISFMLSGWVRAARLGPKGGGTTALTIGCPDDFHAVRLGFPNITPDPWAITRVIGRASTTFNDYVNPTGGGAWTSFTFAMDGRADERIVTRPDAPTRIIVAGNAPDPATGEAAEPVWTFTDWVPLASLPPDEASGMRVLMLRALVPSEQLVCYANGQLRALTGNAALNGGYDCFIGGLKHDYDRVSDPAKSARDTTAQWHDNQLVSGGMFPLVQFLTTRAGIVGMATGDSHHQGTSTTEQFSNFLFRATARLGAASVAVMPFGMVNCAVGGLSSPRFFARLDALLPIVRPSYAVLPGWTFNDRAGPEHAGQTVMALFLARLLASVERCRRLGVEPVILTPFPRDAASMTPVQLGPWHLLRQSLLGLRRQGTIVLDATSVLGRQTGGVFDGTYLPGMSRDAIHPNDAGHAAVATLLAEALAAQIRQPG
jgi:hypothetical protein